jgi:TusA-related sulfurtransferase
LEDFKMAKEVELDCMGEACPIPLIKTEKALEELEVGDTLIVLIDHSCAMKNVPEWARKQGHEVELEEVDDGEWECYIEKMK